MFSPRILSLSSLLAVSRMMGTLQLSRSLAVVRMPSRPGIITSSRIRSTGSRSARRRHSSPS